MENFPQLCEDTKAKLGRQLQEKEKEFLAWVYDNYEKEKQKKHNVSKSLQGV